MQRTVAPGSSGGASGPCARSTSAIRAGMSPGAANDSGRSGRRSERKRRARPPRARRARRRRARARRAAQARRHSCSSQRPVTFRSSRNVPATPPSLVRFAAKVASVISGRVDLEADERPRADAEERRVRAGEAARPRRPTPCRGSRPRRRRPRRGRSPRRRRPSTAPSGVAGRDDLGQEPGGMSSRSSRSPAQPPVRGSKHCVVVAFVSSVVAASAQPVSGRGRGSAAACRAARARGRSRRPCAASSKTVLIGSSWMPVRS